MVSEGIKSKEQVPIQNHNEVHPSLGNLESRPKNLWSSIIKKKYESFKKSFGIYSTEELEEGKNIIKDKTKQGIKQEIEVYEKRSIREGVNFSRCQMGKIVDDYKKGKRVEWETWSPYLSDYKMSTGEIWEDNMIKADCIGLAVGKLFRKIFPKARMISLYDEYNSGMPDTTDFWGKPVWGGSQIEYTQEAKIAFKNNVEKISRKNGLIGENDKEGEGYLLISESSKAVDAEELVRKLEANGNIQREGEAIYFMNMDAENPEYEKILLRTNNGRWQCEALDASTYIKPENFEITHLVVLPNHFKKQQDKVWEMLRVLGIDGSNYHNIFYDENVSPETVSRVIQEEIQSFEK